MKHPFPVRSALKVSPGKTTSPSISATTPVGFVSFCTKEKEKKNTQQPNYILYEFKKKKRTKNSDFLRLCASSRDKPRFKLILVGESPHKCGLCTKSFTRKEHLTNHIRQHTGESPHRCHFCAKSFTRKEHLVNHVRVHTGDSPHRCEFCQKSFTRKEHLTNHLRQHAGEASHCCNVCSKPFSRKVSFFFFFKKKKKKN